MTEVAVQSEFVQTYEREVVLDDGVRVPLYVAEYDRSAFLPRLVRFDQPTPIVEWAQAHGVTEAMNGGFNTYGGVQPLGDIWIGGEQQPHEPWAGEWGPHRGAVEFTADGEIHFGARSALPKQPTGDLLQTGPLLMLGGQKLVRPGDDPEGISAAWRNPDTRQLDDCWIFDKPRCPRAAIGMSKYSIFSVVCDGQTTANIGLSLPDLTDVLADLGADDALNIDGGGKASQLSGGKLRNKPYGRDPFWPHAESKGKDFLWENGCPIYSAIIFERTR